MPDADTRTECALLGALILEPDSIPNAARIVRRNCFHDEINAATYAVIVDKFDKGEKVDLITLSASTELVALFRGSRTKVAAYLADLTSMLASAAHVEEHALMVKQAYIRRQLYAAGVDIMKRAADMSEDVAKIMRIAMQKIDEITADASTGGELVSLSDAIDATIDNWERRAVYHSSGKHVGIPTGLKVLDAVTGGWEAGQLIVIAGRPGMGKSALLNCFVEAAARSGVPVCLFSLEMSRTEVAGRLLVGNSGIKAGAAKCGTLNAGDWETIEKARASLSELPITVCDSPYMSVRDIRSQVLPLHKQGKCDMVAIDYLQLIEVTATNNRNELREREVAKMSRALKGLAKELEIPVVLLAQLSRAAESRADKTPILSDLRESGAIEQDADVVIFIDRPEMRGETLIADSIPAKDAGRLIIAKHRNGKTGEVPFRHNGTMTRISDYDASDLNTTEESEPF